MPQFIYSQNLTPGETDWLLAGLHEHALRARGLGKIESFAIKVVEENGEMIAAIAGIYVYGAVYIDFLVVETSKQNKGLGRELMQRVEILASEHHCTFLTLSTLDWEAKPFYEKLGFHVEFERAGYANDAIMYMMRKNL